MSAAEKLYSPELLGLAVSLAEFPPAPALPLHGSARSKSCGSTLEMDIGLDANRRIDAVGMRVRACAVGQAAAAIFVGSSRGRNRDDIVAAYQDIADWLEGSGEKPRWPGIGALGPARDYPARHGALLLPWNAAIDALSSAPDEG